MKIKKWICTLSTCAIVFTGCGLSTAQTDTVTTQVITGQTNVDLTSAMDENGNVELCSNYYIENLGESYTFIGSEPIAGANGLYYGLWGIGNSTPYENAKGEMTDLYDAQLMILFSHCQNVEDAQLTSATWYTSAKDNYEILSDSQLQIADQQYSSLAYNCFSETNPFARGYSLYGYNDVNAVCLELTCLDTYTGDLEEEMQKIIEKCYFKN